MELDKITTTSGYNQVIDKPTHYINELSLCIDLGFSSNVNFTKCCGVEQSIHQTSHHKIIYGALNFNIPLPLRNIILIELGIFKIEIATKNV